MASAIVQPRAALYVRVSSERQAREEKTSIDTQLADCRALAESRGYQIVGEYVETKSYRRKGKLVQPSGEYADRPEYQAMLKAGRAGAFDVIIAWRGDRLYRSIAAVLPLSKLLEDSRGAVTIELAREPFDLHTMELMAWAASVKSGRSRSVLTLESGRGWQRD